MLEPLYQLLEAENDAQGLLLFLKMASEIQTSIESLQLYSPVMMLNAEGPCKLENTFKWVLRIQPGKTQGRHFKSPDIKIDRFSV
jgi:hypothetical protein